MDGTWELVTVALSSVNSLQLLVHMNHQLSSGFLVYKIPNDFKMTFIYLWYHFFSFENDMHSSIPILFPDTISTIQHIHSLAISTDGIFGTSAVYLLYWNYCVVIFK